LLCIIRIQNLFDKRYLHSQNPLIAPLWEKNEHFARIPSIREKKERDRTLLYYSMPATSTAGSFLLHFPIFFLYPLPPVFPRIRRSFERRRTGVELTKTIKSDFFQADEPTPAIILLRFPLFQHCFLYNSTFSHSHTTCALHAGKNPQVIYLKELHN